MLRVMAMVVGITALATPAVAEIPALCSDQSNQTAMTICAADLLKAADRALNTTYEQLMGKLDSETKVMVRDAQRAWLAFRDKECISQTGGGPNREGTIWPMLYAECQTALTRQRTKDLAEQVKCPGGDLSC